MTNIQKLAARFHFNSRFDVEYRKTFNLRIHLEDNIRIKIYQKKQFIFICYLSMTKKVKYLSLHNDMLM